MDAMRKCFFTISNSSIFLFTREKCNNKNASLSMAPMESGGVMEDNLMQYLNAYTVGS